MQFLCRVSDITIIFADDMLHIGKGGVGATICKKCEKIAEAIFAIVA